MNFSPKTYEPLASFAVYPDRYFFVRVGPWMLKAFDMRKHELCFSERHALKQGKARAIGNLFVYLEHA